MAKDDGLNRAAQFLPFDALKGLSEELQSRIDHRLKMERIELSEEQQQLISDELSKIQIGSFIRINFFMNGHYIDVEGVVENLDILHRYLMIGQKKIFYSNIHDITIIE